MGYQINGRIVYIIVCLCIAAFFIQFKSSSKSLYSKEPLKQIFSDVAEWKGVEDVGLDANIVDSLALDDYLFRTYRNGQGMVSLYIGYYQTAEKVGAAHSPLVCFPGQGWEIAAPRRVSVATPAGKINLEKLIVNKGPQRELLLYWYQSYNMTSSSSFLQKAQNLWARLNSNPEDNAFVRVSVSIQNENTEDAYQKAVGFIQSFYPSFLTYIIQK